MKGKNTPRERAGTFAIAMALLGSLIGAAFLSGQELCQFFGIHGPWQFAAVAIAMVMMFLIGTVILRLAVDTGEGRMDKIVVFFDCKPLRAAVAVFEILFVFMIYLVGVAAFGSLFEQMFAIPAVIGSAVFAATIFFLSLFGIRGLLRFFSMIIPALVVLTLFIGVFALVKTGSVSFPTAEKQGIISGIWPVDGASYAIFALFCMLPVFVPFGATMHGRSQGNRVWRGVLVGMLLFTALLLVILLAIATDPAVREFDMPMIELATRNNPIFGLIYGMLLICGIFSATLSAAASMSEYFARTFSEKRSFLVPVMALSSLAAFGLGLFGFKELVGILFPFFGYLGLIPITLLLIHAFRFYRARRREKRQDTQ